MTTDSGPDDAALERLSALVDGELEGAAVAQACFHWRERAEIRSAWSRYHLIGDVLRSDDLARDSMRDAEFLVAVRARLQGEPVVLAPRPLEPMAPAAQPADTGRSRRGSWMAPSAVAAGFMAVAGVVFLMRGPGTLGNPAPDTSLTLATSAVSLGAGPMPVAGEPQALVATGQLLRDARLDRYLSAHKQFAGSSALGVPSGFLRNATATETER